MSSLLIHFAILFVFLAPKPPKPPKYGVIDPAVFNRTTYPADTTAGAVILNQYVEISFGTNFETERKVYRRILILNSSGLDAANVEVPYSDTKYDRQTIGEKKASIHYRDEKGKVIRKDLEKKDFIVENVSKDGRNLRFTFPGVKAGAILEYQFSVKSSGFAGIGDIPIASSLPIESAICRIEIPAYFQYNVKTIAPYPWSHESITEDARTYDFILKNAQHNTGQWYNLPATTQRAEERFETTVYNWAVENLPALAPEPFLSSTRNYQQRLQFQLEAWGLENQREYFAGSWPKLAAAIIADEDIGTRFNPDGASRQSVERYLQISPLQLRADSIFRFVRNTFTWDERFTVSAQSSFSAFRTEHKGSSADINLYLIKLLRSAGLDATPVFISTRQNGLIDVRLPSLGQFNHVLVALQLEGQVVYLDATSKNSPFGILPEYDIVGQGMRILTNGNPVICNLPKPEPASYKIIVDGDMSLQGHVTGTITFQTKGHGVIPFLNAIDASPEETGKNLALLFTSDSDLSIDSVQIMPGKSEHELTLRMRFKTSQDDAGAGVLLLKPSIIGNPLHEAFKSSSRKLPVEFVHGVNYTVAATIRLPDGIRVESVPAPVVRQWENESSYRRIVQEQPGALQIQERFVNNRLFVDLKQYASFKTYSDGILDAANELISLRSPD